MPRIPATTSLDDAIAVSQRHADAMMAVIAVRDRLSECAPRLEHYNPDAYRHACNEHRARIDMLRRLLLDLGEISQGCRTQLLQRFDPRQVNSYQEQEATC